MSVKRKIKLQQIEGVSAGGTATIKLDRSLRYHAIFLKYKTDTTGGATEANMETEVPEIRVNLNRRTQRKFSAAQLFDINRSKGQSPVVASGTGKFGYLPIFFSEPQRLTRSERESTSWGMKGVDSFEIQVDIANNSGQTPVLEGFAIVDDVFEAPKGIVKVKRNIIQVAATGEVIHNLETNGGSSYQGAYFFEGTAGDIDDLHIKWSNRDVYDLSQEDDNALLPYQGASVVAGMHHVVFDDNYPSDVLPSVRVVQNGNETIPVQSFQATLNMANAANVTLLTEEVGSPD